MASLTDTDKKIIFANSGRVSKDEKVITFEKTHKPSRECKRLLKELGYEISNKSGAPYIHWMEYVLRE